MTNERRIGLALMQFGRAFRRYTNRIIAELPETPVTGIQGLVIRHLYLSEKCGKDVFQRDIEKEFEIGRSTASETLRTMETAGLIHRVSVPQDARLKKLVLSDCMRQHMERISTQIDLAEQKLTTSLTAEELDTFWHVLVKLEQTMEHTTLKGKDEIANDND
jgi:DNA-binding MarR family transcriptional regulator